MLSDIINLKKVTQKLKGASSEGTRYNKLNYAMKGAVGQLSNEELQELKVLIEKEMTAALSFITELQNRQTVVPEEVKQSA